MTADGFVAGDGETVRFGGVIRTALVNDFTRVVSGAINDRSYRRLRLDFSKVASVFPQQMLPVIATVDRLRDQGTDVRLNALPEDRYLAHLFCNCGWPFLLDPDRFQDERVDPSQHLPARRFTDMTGQQAVVTDAVKVIMQSMELDRDVLASLEWSLNEITDNVLNHAEAKLGGLVQVSTLTEGREIHFVVADGGRGVPASMREGFPSLRKDDDALMEAIKQGVTRSPKAGQGNGLAGTLRIATGSKGAFYLKSGRGELQCFKPVGGRDYDQKHTHLPPNLFYSGTVVTVKLGVDTHFRLEELFEAEGISHEPWDIIDAAYTADGGAYLELQVADEAGGHGSRQAGAKLRTKIKNLLAAEPDKRLIIDWKGVPLISSSFADETIGRLFLELGPLSFASRVQSVRMEPLVRSMIDRAVIQRVQQGS